MDIDKHKSRHFRNPDNKKNNQESVPDSLSYLLTLLIHTPGRQVHEGALRNIRQK